MSSFFFWRGGGGCVLRTLLSSPIITLNFQRDVRVIPPVTSQGCLCRAKMAANLGLNQPTSND